jgi:hypothetical protein
MCWACDFDGGDKKRVQNFGWVNLYEESHLQNLREERIK